MARLHFSVSASMRQHVALWVWYFKFDRRYVDVDDVAI